MIKIKSLITQISRPNRTVEEIVSEIAKFKFQQKHRMWGYAWGYILDRYAVNTVNNKEKIYVGLVKKYGNKLTLSKKAITVDNLRVMRYPDKFQQS